MTRYGRVVHVFLLGLTALGLGTPAWAVKFSEARIFIEYNSSANDLGFHVFLDGEDWKTLKIFKPGGATIFEVEGESAFKELGMTELFFEGAEPSLDDFPLDELLDLFPEGIYKFLGRTVDGLRIARRARLSHAVPAGSVVSAEVNGDTVIIRWTQVTSPPPGFPQRPIQIVGYQVIVEDFQVTLPASITEVTVPREYVQSLAPGQYPFEVLAIDVSANQSITEGTFDLP
jgi:hypothetical protein